MFGGSYISLLTLCWANHALNVALVARIAHRLGCQTGMAFLAAVCFGMSPLNYETLGWSVQWSAVLSLSFFLVSLLILVPASPSAAFPSWRVTFLAAACALASPLCFTRGVLVGPVLAVVALSLTTAQPWFIRGLKASVLMLPSLAIAAVVARSTSGNHPHLPSVWLQIVTFAVHYFGESPLRTAFSPASLSTTSAVVLVGARLAISLAAWALAPVRLRPMVSALVFFELGNALLLGIGRYHTGIPAAGSSRYQYSALCCFIPLLALLANSGLRALPNRMVPFAVALAFLGLSWSAIREWSPSMQSWRSWRGAELRAALNTPDFPPEQHFTRLPWMTNQRARELVRRFSLH